MLPRPAGEYRTDTAVPSIPAMSELTGDEWAAVLVSHQWPGSPALATLSAAAASRRAVGSAFHGYADALRSVTESLLSDQRGDAADGIRAAFRGGEDHAREVAERNDAKTAALTSAHRCAAELRSALREIADRGSSRIRAITEGHDPAAVKAARIAEAIKAAQHDADTRAALCMQEIYGSIQTVLDSCGADTSAREFARSHSTGPQASDGDCGG